MRHRLRTLQYWTDVERKWFDKHKVWRPPRATSPPLLGRCCNQFRVCVEEGTSPSPPSGRVLRLRESGKKCCALLYCSYGFCSGRWLCVWSLADATDAAHSAPNALDGSCKQENLRARSSAVKPFPVLQDEYSNELMEVRLQPRGCLQLIDIEVAPAGQGFLQARAPGGSSCLF